MTNKLPWPMRVLVALTRWKLRNKKLLGLAPDWSDTGQETVLWAGTIDDVRVRNTVPMTLETLAIGSEAGGFTQGRVAADATKLRWHPYRKAYVVRDWRVL